jgi:Tol biopolymer transport system component
MTTTPTTELIPRRVLFGNPVNTNPQISPDGKRLARWERMMLNP